MKPVESEMRTPNLFANVFSYVVNLPKSMFVSINKANCIGRNGTRVQIVRPRRAVLLTDAWNCFGRNAPSHSHARKNLLAFVCWKQGTLLENLVYRCFWDWKSWFHRLRKRLPSGPWVSKSQRRHTAIIYLHHEITTR